MGRKPLKFAIPQDTEPAECRGCGMIIYWITVKEKPMPVNPDGVSHFATCPKADVFRRKK